MKCRDGERTKEHNEDIRNKSTRDGKPDKMLVSWNIGNEKKMLGRQQLSADVSEAAGITDKQGAFLSNLSAERAMMAGFMRKHSRFP